ncbi:MAG: hypothetical protein U9P12_02900, partial [Verrucomicrobiota bacterium]|nr:hypothetical protein [Verrucomicrobiota bacterium]
MNYEKRMYMVLYPNSALIASQYDPEMFARHYTSGSSRHYSGKVVFAEVDVGYRNDFFDIGNILDNLSPHADGRPKATKFIASYRVLEHVDLSAIGKLYISTEEGHCIGLERGESDSAGEESIRIYAEIAPMRMLVMSKYNPQDFGVRITDPGHSKSAPKQFYTQLNIDIPEFLEEFARGAVALNNRYAVGVAAHILGDHWLDENDDVAEFLVTAASPIDAVESSVTVWVNRGIRLEGGIGYPDRVI